MKYPNSNNCLICGEFPSETMFTVIDHETGEDFYLEKCSNCGLKWVQNPPAPEDLWRYYQSLMGQSMRRHPGRIFSRLREVRLRQDVRPLVSVLRPGCSVIDYGTGDGSMAQVLNSYGLVVEARDQFGSTEWNHATIDYKKIDVAKPSRNDFMVDGKPANAVVMRHVLEHTPNPRKLLDLVSSAGVEHLVVIVPNSSSLFAKIFGRDWYYWDPPRHLFHFDVASLMALADAMGADLVSIKRHGIDEMLCSVNRRIRRRRYENNAAEMKNSLLLRLTHPTGLPAGLLSGITGLVSRGVIRAHIQFAKNSDS